MPNNQITTKLVPNNQINKVLPAKPLPADSYKNNLLKAKAEEETRADLKAGELAKNTGDLYQTSTNQTKPWKNPNIATGDSPPKEIPDKSSATFISVVSSHFFNKPRFVFCTCHFMFVFGTFSFVTTSFF